jgi:hypothetical protein
VSKHTTAECINIYGLVSNKEEYSVYLSIVSVTPLSNFIRDLQYCYKEVLLVGDKVYALIDAASSDIGVDKKYIKNGNIVLDISPGAIKEFIWHEGAMAFRAKFKGKQKSLRIPFEYLKFIYSGNINFGFDVAEFDH